MSDTKIIEQNENPQEIPHELSQPVIPESVQLDTEVAPERPIVIDGREYQTNLPKGVQLIEPEGGLISSARLIPKDFDALSPGKYVVHGGAERGTFGEISEGIRRIEVRENESGKTILNESFSYGGQISVSEDALGLMQEIGYDIGSVWISRVPNITGVPTPETLKAAAGLMGVEIQFFPKVGVISDIDYLRAFADGKYPVSTKEELQYMHDIQDDHITAMVLGGEPLKLALAEVASRAIADARRPLRRNRSTGDTASMIDTFTAILRAVVSRGTTDVPFILERGRSTLIKRGEALGLTAEKTQEILEHAQEIGRTMGLEVMELQ